MENSPSHHCSDLGQEWVVEILWPSSHTLSPTSHCGVSHNLFFQIGPSSPPAPPWGSVSTLPVPPLVGRFGPHLQENILLQMGFRCILGWILAGPNCSVGSMQNGGCITPLPYWKFTTFHHLLGGRLLMDGVGCPCICWIEKYTPLVWDNGLWGAVEFSDMFHHQIHKLLWIHGFSCMGGNVPFF